MKIEHVKEKYEDMFGENVPETKFRLVFKDLDENPYKDYFHHKCSTLKENEDIIGLVNTLKQYEKKWKNVGN